uniref:Ovomucoid n=1 Tax=Gopherus agassizii TaxID=38772 RepID=A0A452GFS1_9SAUR
HRSRLVLCELVAMGQTLSYTRCFSFGFSGDYSMCPVCVHYILKPMCILYYHPVCGSDGRTYRNKCELCSYCREHDKNIKIVKEGSC